MLIASWNVNGLRAVAKRGFLDWLTAADIDILCLQEIKANQNQLPAEIVEIIGYQGYFNCAVKRGYSGVAVYTRQAPRQVTSEIFGDEQFNHEGRVLLLEFDQFSVLNIYLPHGGRDQAKLAYKLRVYQKLHAFLSTYPKPLIITGDFNVAHHDIDLARPRQNRKNIMFTPRERAQIDQLTTQGFIDTYRHLNPNAVAYTWWPHIADCRNRNIGWRLDYIFASRSVQSHSIEAKVLSNIRGSDHCPITLAINQDEMSTS